MVQRTLTMALDRYDRHVPFFDGTLELPQGLDIRFLQVGQVHDLRDGGRRHDRMYHDREFNISEFSFASYVMARARGLPLTAVPAITRRHFSQSQMFVRADSDLDSPAGLEGARVGLHGFATGLSVLAKGDLKFEYGVPWESIEWVVTEGVKVPFTLKRGVRLVDKPWGKEFHELLLDGEIDALFHPAPPKTVMDNPAIRRLFRDSKAEQLGYFRKYGYCHIMHLIVMPTSLAAERPELPRQIYALYQQALAICDQYYLDPMYSILVWGRDALEEQRAALGENPLPQGFSGNRLAAERFIEYAHDQGLIDAPFEPELLFHESVLDT